MSEPISTVKSRGLEHARRWIAANQPEPTKCIHCGKISGLYAGATIDTWCANSPTHGHTYQFTLTTDPDAEAKRLVAYAKSVIESLAEEAERVTIAGALKSNAEIQREREQWLEFAAWLRSKGVEK